MALASKPWTGNKRIKEQDGEFGVEGDPACSIPSAFVDIRVAEGAGDLGSAEGQGRTGRSVCEAGSNLLASTWIDRLRKSIINTTIPSLPPFMPLFDCLSVIGGDSLVAAVAGKI